MSGAEASARFWDGAPCGRGNSLEERSATRFKREPWLPALLSEVAKHNDIVEVGCGQGTDALWICRSMRPGGNYRALDHSEQSLASARAAFAEGTVTSVKPVFCREDALALSMPDNSVACVYSCGVIHHIDDTEGAVAEIHRILQPGGHCYVMIYRTASPKLLVAHLLRGLQSIIDKLTRRTHSLLRAAEFLGLDKMDGTTMVRECFGVPVLKSYTKAGARRLFAHFEIVSIESRGFLWLVEARRPHSFAPRTP